MTFGKLILENKEYILQCSPPYYLGLIKTYGSIEEMFLRTDKPLIQAVSNLSTITIKGTLTDSRIELSAEGINNLKQLARNMANYFENL